MLKILSETQDYTGNKKIKIWIRFENRDYLKEFTAYPIIIENFKSVLKKAGEMKAYHYIRKHCRECETTIPEGE